MNKDQLLRQTFERLYERDILPIISNQRPKGQNNEPDKTNVSMEHIKLITIKRQLQAKMNYPIDPEPFGEHLTLNEAFDELLEGFADWLQRNGKGAKYYLYAVKKRGWMSAKQADQFTDYCIKGWRVV